MRFGNPVKFVLEVVKRKTGSPPWNKGKCVGQKKPLTPDQVQQIKTRLEVSVNTRDLVLFATAFDTMLRAVDLLSLTVDDVRTIDGEIRETFSIRQQKTGKGNLVSLTPYTRKALKAWIAESEKGGGDYLFTAIWKGRVTPLSTDQYRNLIKGWVRSIGLDPRDYSSHSLRRTKASWVYKESRHDIKAVQHLLGHKSIASTASYLGVEREEALGMAKKFEF